MALPLTAVPKIYLDTSLLIAAFDGRPQTFAVPSTLALGPFVVDDILAAPR